MLNITDVSQDPTAPSRSRLRPELVAEARANGFEHAGWVSAVPTSLASEPTDDDVLIDRVMVHRDGGAVLDLTQWRELEDVAVRTLFEDGTVVLTGRVPSKGWWKLRWGLTSAPQHGWEMAYVRAHTIADLVAVHEERVRRHRESGHRPLARHDMRAYLATRRRWREIADARMRRQETLARNIAIATMLATAAGGALLSRAAVARFGAETPNVALVGMILTASAAIAAGIGSFVFSLYFVAAILAQRTAAPKTRHAPELLELADAVPAGWLPPARPLVPAKASAQERPALVRASPAELARLQKIELGIVVANALVLPLAGLFGTITIGMPALAAALGIVFTMDGAIALLTKKTRVELLRERFVPSLVQAEKASACESGACATPLGKKVLGSAWLFGGLACLYSARAAFITAGGAQAPAWLVGEWAVLAIVTAFFAVTRVRKKHKRLAAA